MDLQLLHGQYLQRSLLGRYITNEHIMPILEEAKASCQVRIAGSSVLEKPIYTITAGNGEKRIYMWSQMHGNESTTTKALFDLLSFLASDSPYATLLHSRFTFLIVPIANPDGGEKYTRENANGVDINRDSVNLSQPESQLLRKLFDEFAPHYAFNMHDQRTIFGVGDTGKPATVSFLAPSYNEAREINDTRQLAINVITSMDKTLQQYIPGQVGRFDDSFNINCIGDMFQSLGVPTVLFEAGHSQNDYDREATRKYIFIALLSAFNAIHENVIAVNESSHYFDIPQNKTNYYDVICKNVKINYENKQIITNFASHYNEILFENSVKFTAVIKEIGNLTGFYSHAEYDAMGAEFLAEDGNPTPVCGEKANFTLLPDRVFVNGVEIM